MCPYCGSGELTGHAFDYGRCSQTDYHDAGEGFRCLSCGKTGDAADVGSIKPA